MQRATRQHLHFYIIKTISCIAFIVTIHFPEQGLAQIGGDAGVRSYIAKDYQNAFAIWKSKARNGDALAMFGLGLLHQKGLGRTASPTHALGWYKSSCDQDYFKACYNAGLLAEKLLLDAYGAKQAERYFLMAAENGHPSAQHALGLLYLRGRPGIPPNLAQAKIWLEQSHANGHKKSAALLSHLNAGKLPTMETASGEPSDPKASAQNSDLSTSTDNSIQVTNRGTQMSCPPSPDVPWWGNNTHSEMKDVVAKSYQGKWEGYYAKWDRYRKALEKGLANNKTARVKQYGITLKGPTLSSYIKKVSRRLTVIKCVADREKRKLFHKETRTARAASKRADDSLQEPAAN